jgi:gluconate 2-dehydrogenase alpha chain
LFTEAGEEFGYHPYRIPSANLSEAYENPDGETINACVYCSFCTLYGCDFGAKSDPVITVLATAEKTGNYELRNHAYATRVLHNGGRATGVLYTDTQTGQEYEQPADIVVLGAFIFSNTRLLLLSEIGEPYDPATGRGIIGRNFTGHFSNLTYNAAIGFFEDKKFNNFAGAGALGTTLDDFNAEQLDHNEVDFLHGIQLYIRQTGQTPIANNPVPAGTAMWGKEFKDKSLYYSNRNVRLEHMEGVLPWRHNYMDLDPTYTDFAGNPLLRITTRFTDQERNITRFAYKKAEELLTKMGADIINVPEVTDETEFGGFSIGNHSAGGAIMGDNPETSAVNNYSQMWDMENLFVVGASSFPHFSSYNPTGTMGALAYRATEGMIEYLKNGGGLLVEPRQG